MILIKVKNSKYFENISGISSLFKIKIIVAYLKNYFSFKIAHVNTSCGSKDVFFYFPSRNIFILKTILSIFYGKTIVIP